MAASFTPPQYIYKIVPAGTPPPDPLPVALPVSALDTRDQFLHMSTSRQVLGTLNAFFGAADSVYLLRVAYAAVAADVRWENAVGKTADEPGGCWDDEGRLGFFPHIYRWAEPPAVAQRTLKLGRDEIESVGCWKRSGATWTPLGWPFGDTDVPVTA